MSPENNQDNIATSESKAFKMLTQEEIAKLPPHEKSMYRFDRDRAKAEKDIVEAEKEIEILFDMAKEFTSGVDATPEQIVLFTQKLKELKRFQESDCAPYLTSLLRDNKGGEPRFGEQINVLQEYVDGWKKDITQVEKDRESYLDEQYAVS